MFIKELMIAAADRYVMYLRKRSNGAFTFVSELNAANRVLNDKLVIQEFFESHMIMEEHEAVEDVNEDEFVRSNVREMREMRMLIESHFEQVLRFDAIVALLDSVLRTGRE